MGCWGINGWSLLWKYLSLKNWLVNINNFYIRNAKSNKAITQSKCLIMYYGHVDTLGWWWWTNWNLLCGNGLSKYLNQNCFVKVWSKSIEKCTWSCYITYFQNKQRAITPIKMSESQNPNYTYQGNWWQLFCESLVQTQT